MSSEIKTQVSSDVYTDEIFRASTSQFIEKLLDRLDSCTNYNIALIRTKNYAWCANCFYDFVYKQIESYTDDGDTAVCPNCASYILCHERAAPLWRAALHTRVYGKKYRTIYIGDDPVLLDPLPMQVLEVD